MERSSATALRLWLDPDESPQEKAQNLVKASVKAILERANGSPSEMRYGPLTALVSAWIREGPSETDARLTRPKEVERALRAGRLRTADRIRRAAGDDLDSIIRDGLVLREGSLLVPPMVLEPAMALDALTYEALVVWREQIHPDPQEAIEGAPSVCRGCTHVFRPGGRKRRAAYCRTCAKRPPPLSVFGFPAIDMRVLTNRGKPPDGYMDQPIRKPKLSGRRIVGWGTARILRCEECRKAFVSVRAQQRYCDAKCRKRAGRRLRSAPASS